MSKRKLAPSAKAYPSEEEIRANAIPRTGDDPDSIVLGLDLSSSCIGWAVGLNGQIVTWGKFVYKSTATMGEKLLAFEEFYVGTLLKTYNPTVCVVEKPLTRRGATTARHNQLLGIVLKCWYKYAGFELKDSWLISSRTIKNLLGVPRGRDHDENKQIMVKKINDLLGIRLRWAKSRHASEDDPADAIATIICYWRLNVRKRKKKNE